MTPDEEFEQYRSQLTRTFRTKIEQCECGCYVWMGALDSSGYGSIKMRGVVTIAHRYAYAKLVGPIVLDGDDDPTLDHLCSNTRRCMNVSHMEIVSRSENSTRANERRWDDARERDCDNCDGCVLRRGD